MMAAYRRTHSPSGWLVLGVGSRLALSRHSSYEPIDASSVTVHTLLGLSLLQHIINCRAIIIVIIIT